MPKIEFREWTKNEIYPGLMFDVYEVPYMVIAYLGDKPWYILGLTSGHIVNNGTLDDILRIMNENHALPSAHSFAHIGY